MRNLRSRLNRVAICAGRAATLLRPACVAIILAVSGVSAARGAVTHNFVLTPEQVVPPSASIAAGQGSATLNDTETTLTVSILHGVENATQATVREANWGSNGVTLFTVNPVGTNGFQGVWNIDTAGLAALEAGRLYVQVDSVAFPAGAIRGQIDLNPDPQPGDVIISEIMYNPASIEGDFDNDLFTSNAEWIELFNTSYTDINIGGWFFQDEDVDESGDACTPLRGGSFPDFILRSFEVVVVIPDGAEIFGQKPTVADFRTAWGLPSTVNVIQLNTNGTADGALVGRNLSNAPLNDEFDINDLPLDAPYWQPCDPFGFERLDNEILTLNDGTQIIDVVNYAEEFPFPSEWPVNTFDGSITIVPDDYPSATSFASYTAAGNDIGSNWRAHMNGDEAGGVVQANSSGVYSGLDVGSPGYLYGASPGNRAPTAVQQQVLTHPGLSEVVPLIGTDTTRPFFGLLLFRIKSLPQNGELWDIASNVKVTPAMVAGDGYLMPRIPFNQVRYDNTGGCGLDTFTFTTFDGLLESAPTTVEMFVQCGDVVITEIMYNPDSTEDNPAATEWVELYNATDAPINLAGWYLADNATRSGEFPPYILGAHSTVVVTPSAGDPDAFSDAWLVPPLHTTSNGENGNGGLAGSNLGNAGESLRVVMPGGALPLVSDAVFYESGFDNEDWPRVWPDGPSIYMLPGSGYTTLANDDPAVWDTSLAGFDGAFVVVNNTVFDGVDVGSPCYLQDVSSHGCAAGGPLCDGNGDGTIDLLDARHFEMCMAGPQASLVQNCACFDADLDEDLDLADYHFLQRHFGGTPPPPPPPPITAGLIITEVVDGTLTNGEPKLIELTNCGDTTVDLADYRIALYTNGDPSENFLSMVYGEMSGTLAPGVSYVIANTNAGPGDSFLLVYGQEADLYHGVANGNGNDVYQLLKSDGATGDLAIDVFGVRGVDGTGKAWDYNDSYAVSQPGRGPNGGVFNASHWNFAGPDALNGFSAAQIAAATSAGTHTCD